jgi:hypothetical protein
MHGVRLSQIFGNYAHATQDPTKLDQPHLSESEDHHFEFALSPEAHLKYDL